MENVASSEKVAVPFNSDSQRLVQKAKTAERLRVFRLRKGAEEKVRLLKHEGVQSSVEGVHAEES